MLPSHSTCVQDALNKLVCHTVERVGSKDPLQRKPKWRGNAHVIVPSLIERDDHKALVGSRHGAARGPHIDLDIEPHFSFASASLCPKPVRDTHCVNKICDKPPNIKMF